MKKIISLIVLLGLMIWTWDIIHSTPAVTFETHSIMQQRLAEIIKNSVQKYRPAAQNFNLVRLWTETVNPEKVKAHFTYRFIDGEGDSKTEQTVSGEAFLLKTSSEGNEQENWKIEKVQTSANQVIFDEGLTITPEGETTAPNEPPPTSEAPTAQPPKSQNN